MTTRNTHSLVGNHKGTLGTNRVRVVVDDKTLQVYLADLHDTLAVRESAGGTHRKRFTIDATVSA